MSENANIVKSKLATEEIAAVENFHRELENLCSQTFDEEGDYREILTYLRRHLDLPLINDIPEMCSYGGVLFSDFSFEQQIEIAYFTFSPPFYPIYTDDSLRDGMFAYVETFQYEVFSVISNACNGNIDDIVHIVRNLNRLEELAMVYLKLDEFKDSGHEFWSTLRAFFAGVMSDNYRNDFTVELLRNVYFAEIAKQHKDNEDLNGIPDIDKIIDAYRAI